MTQKERRSKGEAVINKGRFTLGNVNAMQAFHVMRQAGLMLASIVLAKSALSTQEIGQWEMLLYIGYTLSFFWASGLVQGMLTLFPKLEEDERKPFVFNVYLLFAGISAMVLLLLWIAREPTVLLLTNQRSLPHVGAFSLFLALHMPVYLLENLYLLHQRPRSIFWFGVFSSLGHVLSIGIPVWAGMGLGGGVGGMTLFAGLRHGLLLLFVLQHGALRFRFTYWKRLVSLSLPLMGYSVLGGLQVALGSWFVAFLFPEDQSKFAVYRYGALELPFALALTNGFGMAMLPEIAKDLNQALHDIREKSLRLFHLLFPVAIVVMLTSRWLFPLAFRDAFADSVPIFNIFLMILITRMMFSRTVLVGLEANSAVLWISVVEIIVFAALCYFWGGIWGLAGIAWATLWTYAVEKALLCAVLYRRFGIGVGAYTHLGWFMAYATLMIGAYLAVSSIF